MEKDVRAEIGARLKEVRLSAGLSQADVARVLGANRQTVSAWECGRSMPSGNDWYRIGKLYGASLDYIVYGIRMVPARQYGAALSAPQPGGSSTRLPSMS